MKSTFKLYSKDTKSNISDSIFTIIGAQEPDLTKSLAYLFKRNSQLLKRIIDKMGFDDITTNYSSVFISAEQRPDRGEEDIRRDISIILNYGKGKSILIVIEAKNLSLKTTSLNADIEDKLLNSYLSSSNYSDCDECERKFGVTLTRESMLFTKDRICSLLWEDVLRILIELEKSDQLIYEFKEHLMNTDLIKTYEEEIMSPPCGDTHELIDRLKIYCCPAKRSLKDSIYFLPRIPVNKNEALLEAYEGVTREYVASKKGKGFATKLFKIKSCFIVDVSTIEAIEDKGLAERVKIWYDSFPGENRLQVFELDNECNFYKPIFTDLQNNADTRYPVLQKILTDNIIVLRELIE